MGTLRKYETKSGSLVLLQALTFVTIWLLFDFVCRRKDHVFFSITVPVHDLTKTRLNPGELSLPFALDLPPYLPSSSMHKLGVGDVGFRIQYKLTARMGGYSRSLPVAIAAAALEGTRAPFVMQPTTQPVFSTNGSTMGSITVAATVHNIILPKGGKISFSVSCRNDSLVNIQRVEVKIVELLNWGLNEKYSKTRAHKVNLACIDNLELTGLEKDSVKKSKVVDANYPTMEEQIKKYSEMHEDLASGSNVVEMEIPMRSRDSYSGMLVDIRHYLKIKFVTGTFGSQPFIKIPLKIGLPNEIPKMSGVALAELASSTLLEIEHDRNVSGCSGTSRELPLACATPILLPSITNIDQNKVYSEETPLSREQDQQHKSAVGDTSLHDLVPLTPSIY